MTVIDVVVKTYEALIKLSSLADKYNELVNAYKDLISKKIEIKVPQLGAIPVPSRVFREFKALPIPACVETNLEFNEVYFGRRICLRQHNVSTTEIKCYSSEMTLSSLIELSCNVGDVLEKLAKDLEQYNDVLPKIIETLKTIVAEARLLS